MNDEDRQRQMDFILSSQTQFADHLQKVGEWVDRLERVVGFAVRAGIRERRSFRERHNALFESQAKLAAAQARLTEAQAHTDDRLNILVKTVERFIGGR